MFSQVCAHAHLRRKLKVKKKFLKVYCLAQVDDQLIVASTKRVRSSALSVGLSAGLHKTTVGEHINRWSESR